MSILRNFDVCSAGFHLKLLLMYNAVSTDLQDSNFSAKLVGVFRTNICRHLLQLFGKTQRHFFSK
jgi:hypothetical protein